jgi:pSer/pThr/pTyr-binding forkhead associated (FHA) protein
MNRVSEGPRTELDTISLAHVGPVVKLCTGSGPAETTITCRRVVTLIGSKEGCKAVLKNRRIDPVHLAVIHTGQDVIAVDLLSRSGTLLNGLKMQYERLHADDRLTLGPWEFTIRIEHPSEGKHADLHPFGLEPTPQVIALEHVATRRILQPGREACIIGRRAGCDIAVPDNAASRVHAILFKFHGYPAICDLLSRNQTLVNHAPVTFQILRNDDVITIGETQFRVRLHTGVVGERSTTPKSAPASEVAPVPVTTSVGPDLIDIASTEGSQRWSIVDDYERARRKTAV